MLGAPRVRFVASVTAGRTQHSVPAGSMAALADADEPDRRNCLRIALSGAPTRSAIGRTLLPSPEAG